MFRGGNISNKTSVAGKKKQTCGTKVLQLPAGKLNEVSGMQFVLYYVHASNFVQLLTDLGRTE